MPLLAPPFCWTSGNFCLGISSFPQMSLKSPCDAWGDAEGCWPGQGLCRDLGIGVLGALLAVSGVGCPCGVACVIVSRIMSVISPLQLEEQVPGEVNKFILTSSKGFSATLGKKGGFGKLEINI